MIIFGRLLEKLGGHTTLVAGGQKARLLEVMGVVQAAIDFDSLPIHELFSDKPVDQYRLPEMLGRHDILVSCFAGGEDGAGRRLQEFCGAGEAFFLPTRPPADFPGHLLEYWAAQMRLSLDKDFSAWSVPDGWMKRARQLLKNAGANASERFVVIHPGSGGREKCWPIDRFETLAGQIESGGQRKPQKTIWVFGQVEVERWERDEIQSISDKFASIICPSLEDICGLLSLARGYVGNDSGFSHLAAAVGCPTVAIFGPTSPAHFRPLGPKVEVLGGLMEIGKIEPAAVYDTLVQIFR
ncbi:MAG: glycosyltransferase family 9 protein [Planctomycetes bacterium]|nr:glycosyltransferase family 9 protein [Planctomycetota bacterium]